eukprot:12410674-Karenia_brevis.AAC.1
MGGSSRSMLRRTPTTAADPSPALASVAEEIDADLDRPNILPSRRQIESEIPATVDSDDEGEMTDASQGPRLIPGPPGPPPAWRCDIESDVHSD